jgi:hypothetical protein
VTRLYATWSSTLNRHIAAALGEGNAAATEALGNIRTVRTMSTEGAECATYETLTLGTLGIVFVIAVIGYIGGAGVRREQVQVPITPSES